MLHILLLILKIIGIILAVILGILVLLVCIVLFAPIRYEADGVCKGSIGTLKAKIRVTWLLHFVRADVYYKEKKLRWRVRIAWKRITGGEKFGNSYDHKEDVKDECESKELQEAKETTSEEKTEKNRKTEINETTSEELEKTCEEQKEITKECKEASEVLEEEKPDDKTPSEKHGEQISKESDKESGRIEKIYKKIKGVYSKIKYTLKKICDKIKSLLEKKEKITEFIQNEVHVNAFLKVKSEAFRIIKILKPKEFNLKAIFGFDDPQRTGQVLAFLAVLYPFFEDNIEVVPDFEKSILKGKLHIKGYIRCCHFAALACRLLLCKNIRITYKDIKNFEL